MIFVFFAMLAALHFGLKKQSTPQKAGAPSVPVQPISWQAAQGFAQGNASSTRFRKAGEGNRAIAQAQPSVMKGTSSAAGTQRVMADLQDRLTKTFDPQWRMRYANAYHRMWLQNNIDQGQDPGADLNIDRTVEEVNNDTGQVSGFTRGLITYMQRFTRGKPRMGAGPNATRQLDQCDPGDQTTMQTTLNPEGFKSIIYPRAEHDRDGVKKPWPGLKTVNLERDYWAKSGRPYNQVGATQADMPTHKGWMWAFRVPKRGKHGAYPSGKALPDRSNINSDSTCTGGGTS
jgi:hypothetical protein